MSSSYNISVTEQSWTSRWNNRLQGIKRGDVVWRMVTQEFPGVQPVFIRLRTHQGTELGGQRRLSRGLLLDNPAGMTGGALALAEHIPDHILIGVTGIALPMVHGTDLPDAQEGFDGTDAVLIVVHGQALQGRHGCLGSVRQILIEDGRTARGDRECGQPALRHRAAGTRGL